MKGFLLSVLAVFAGVVLTFTVVLIGEAAGHVVFPPPPGVTIDLNDPASIKAVMEKLPMAALVIIIVVWGIATFAGSWFATWLAARLSRFSVGHGIAVGIIIMLATLTTLVSIPHPVWMWVSGVAAVLTGTYLGAVLLGGRSLRGKPLPVKEFA